MEDKTLEMVHGGSLVLARRLFADAPTPWIDLSTGINPKPYPMPALTAEDWIRLPEPGAIAALEAAAARFYGVGGEMEVVAAPGSQILINLMPRLMLPGEVGILSPTYSEHAPAWRAAGHRVGETPNAARLIGAHAAVVVNPNNPDGRVLRPLELSALAAGCEFLLIDEAFADFSPLETSFIPVMPGQGVVVTRSFGKAFGLAGLRLGFAVAAPELAGQIRAALGPWAISGPALVIAGRAFEDRAWFAETKVRLEADIDRLDRLLVAAGARVVGGTLLFRLIESDKADALFTRLGHAGILVRRFVDRPGQLRLGLPGDDAAWARLAQALGVAHLEEAP